MNPRTKAKSKTIWAAAALFGLLAGGCGEYSASVGGGGTGTLSASAAVSFCASGSTCAPTSSFTLRGLRDLDLSIEWQNLTPGTHAQSVTFLLPNGDLYRTYESSFVVADGSSTATTSQALPVAGTAIAQRSMGGAWQVTVALDGKQISTQTVTLNP